MRNIFYTRRNESTRLKMGTATAFCNTAAQRCVRMNRHATVEQISDQMKQEDTNSVSQTTVHQTTGPSKQTPDPCTYADCCSLATKAGIGTPVPQMDVH
ncbi:hypothetical protein TNCV_1668971 [Trichonephila clavipes]|nr:hypothetical protein TNCV_1668971 [Trichonephila clavipes]